MKARLFSLDALRGFDMLLLLYGSTIAWSMADIPWMPQWILTQFSHPWGVYTLFDIIQPLFAVVCGAAVPLALGKRMTAGRAGRVYWRHVLGRFALLLFLGAVCSGLLTLDPAKAPYFGNTLQLLGFGYLSAAFCFAYLPRRTWLLVSLGLVVAWGLALRFGGDLTPEGNVAVRIERVMNGLFVPARRTAPVKNVSWGTIPMFVALTVLGAYVLCWLRDETRSAVRRANGLLLSGSVLVAVGIGIHFVQPEIKQIYTPAYTLISAGVSLVLLGGFSWIFDICAVRRGTWLLILYGRSALASYMLWGLFGKYLQTASAGLLGGCTARFVAAPYVPLVNMCGTLVLSTSLLWLWTLRNLNREKRK